MDLTLVVALVLLGLLVGVAGAWLAQHSRPESTPSPTPELLDAVRAASAQGVAIQGAQLNEQLVMLAEAKYGALHERTDTVLQGHSRQVDDGLRSLGDRLAKLEQERQAATVELGSMVRSLSEANEATRSAAAGVANALRNNQTRGVWGEVQLRRVLELAGMERNVSFIEQQQFEGPDGRGRPDVVVPLANGRCVVIDSKVPLDRYLDAANTEDADRQAELLRSHARAVGSHVAALASRDYASKVDGAIDLILLFLPADPFLAAALDADPSLLESAARRNVHLVTPSSLLPVLRGIALGWRERRADEQAAEIHRLGVELHERFVAFANHYAKVGAQLDKAVRSYNDSVGSFETRAAVSVRRMAELGVDSTRELRVVEPINISARRLATAEAPEGADALGQPSEADELLLTHPEATIDRHALAVVGFDPP